MNEIKKKLEQEKRNETKIYIDIYLLQYSVSKCLYLCTVLQMCTNSKKKQKLIHRRKLY